MNTLASWAEPLARALLQEPLPRRWAHSQGVAARARSLAPVLGADADLLEAAAWLHDIGYAPGLAFTGLHQLDGARYLRDAQHADALLCRLVAHHSCAIIEASERGLADVLSREFEPAPDVLSSVLTLCDMTTSPDGELVPGGIGFRHPQVKKPARGELEADTKTRNALLRSLRYQGERGFALMSQRWRVLQHVMVSPTAIGDNKNCPRPGAIRAQGDRLSR